MDPLTALSVAGTIVQFADFGGKLLSQTRQLYTSSAGALTVNDELELVTVDLRSVIAKLRLSFHSSDITGPFAKHHPEYRVALEKICREASRAAEELVERLDKLKVKSSKHRRWNSFCQALEAAWSKEEIDALKGRLSSLKKALETRVLFSIRADIDTVSILTSSRFDSLDKETRLIISSL